MRDFVAEENVCGLRQPFGVTPVMFALRRQFVGFVVREWVLDRFPVHPEMC